MTATVAQRLEYYSLRGVVRGLAALDWETACRMGGRLGTMGYKPLRIRKHVVETQIAAAFPDLTQAEVEIIARASFAHLGRTAIETALLPGIGRQGCSISLREWRLGALRAAIDLAEG